MIIVDNGRHPIRGFLSYYISILTSFKHLIDNGADDNNIRIDPYFFKTYGIASNWFDKNRLAFASMEDSIFYSTDSWSIDPWPTKDQLDLIKYKKYFDYNDKTIAYLNDNMKDIRNCIGIHFRGTDHYHTDRVEVDRYVSEALKIMNANGIDKIFIATDEDQIIEKIEQSIPDANIIHNNTIKSYGNISVFDKDMDSRDKVLSGFEVLLDCHSLAICDIVIGKLSNVNYYSRILNPDLKIIYLDEGSEVR